MPSPRRLPAAYLTRRRWTIADARAALAAWDASGLSMLTFAAREGIDARRLYRWRRRLEAQKPAVVAAGEPMPEFIEVRPRSVEAIEVVLRSGRVLRVPETIDPGTLARLAWALEEPSPC